MLAFQKHVLIGCRKCQSYECHRRRFWSYFPLGDDVGFVQSIHRKYKASRGNYEGIYQLKILLKLNSGVLGFSLPASSYRGGNLHCPSRRRDSVHYNHSRGFNCTWQNEQFAFTCL